MICDASELMLPWQPLEAVFSPFSQKGKGQAGKATSKKQLAGPL